MSTLDQMQRNTRSTFDMAAVIGSNTANKFRQRHASECRGAMKPAGNRLPGLDAVTEIEAPLFQNE